MIEKLINSQTRIKILKLFLSHIDDRYYLRELERMLGESLSPLRRQLVKLTELGILTTEEEANLKYYRVNKNFERLEELKEMVLGKDAVAPLTLAARNDDCVGDGFKPSPTFRYDLAILSFISIFVLATAMFVVYANNKNIKQVANVISNKTVLDSSVARGGETRSNTIVTSNGEMASKKWKVLPGSIPVFSTGETGQDKNSKEL